MTPSSQLQNMVGDLARVTHALSPLPLPAALLGSIPKMLGAAATGQLKPGHLYGLLTSGSPQTLAAGWVLTHIDAAHRLVTDGFPEEELEQYASLYINLMSVRVPRSDKLQVDYSGGDLLRDALLGAAIGSEGGPVGAGVGAIISVLRRAGLAVAKEYGKAYISAAGKRIMGELTHLPDGSVLDGDWHEFTSGIGARQYGVTPWRKYLRDDLDSLRVALDHGSGAGLSSVSPIVLSFLQATADPVTPVPPYTDVEPARASSATRAWQRYPCALMIPAGVSVAHGATSKLLPWLEKWAEMREDDHNGTLDVRDTTPSDSFGIASYVIAYLACARVAEEDPSLPDRYDLIRGILSGRTPFVKDAFSDDFGLPDLHTVAGDIRMPDHVLQLLLEPTPATHELVANQRELSLIEVVRMGDVCAVIQSKDPELFAGFVDKDGSLASRQAFIDEADRLLAGIADQPGYTVNYLAGRVRTNADFLYGNDQPMSVVPAVGD